jgi:hypothetical protein
MNKSADSRLSFNRGYQIEINSEIRHIRKAKSLGLGLCFLKFPADHRICFLSHGSGVYHVPDVRDGESADLYRLQ